MSDHIPEAELLKRLEAATQQIEVGATYQHYKSLDKLYRVLDVVIQEADNQPCVIYQALYGLRLKFSRPVSVWLEQVEFNGQQVPRFRKL